MISDLDSAEARAAPDVLRRPSRNTDKPPEQSAANCQQERKNQQFGTSYPLRAAFSVIPGQDQRNEETDAKRDDDETHRLFGPAKSLRDNVDALEQRERRRDIGQRPLHQLALLQASKEFIHRGESFSHRSSRADVLLHRQQFLKAGIVADWVPHWIDFQACDGNGLARRDREKFFQILHCFRRSTGLRLNLGQGCQVSGTKHRVFLGWQKIECMSGDVDGIRLATQREINPT